MRAPSRIGAALTLLAACALACAANEFSTPPPAPDSGASDSTTVSLERACETALARLDEMLSRGEADSTTSAVDLAEARELRREAIDLISAADYRLALELIADAIAVLDRGRS